MAFSVFDRSVGRSLGERVDANGKVKVKAVADAALTVKVPYGVYIGYDGWRTAPLASVTTAASDSVHFYTPRWKIGFPENTAATGDEVWMQIGGYCSATISTATTFAAGEFVEISGGSIVLGMSTASIPDFNTFAVAYSATSSTSVELMLLNKFVIGRA